MSSPSKPATRTSRAAIFTAPHAIGLSELPIPELLAGEALVRVTCCTICGSDLHTFTGARSESVPSILGHEILGVVDSVGDPPLCDLAGNPLRVDDRVTWSTSITCGYCDRCQEGIPQKCRSLRKYGHELAKGRTALSGGLAEFVLLQPGSSVIKLQPDIPDEVVCPVNCATATVAAAIRSAGSIAGKRVLIFGAGMLGLTAAAYAKSYGATRVVVCDRIVHRLDRAARFGADLAIAWHDDLSELTRSLHAGECVDLFDVILEMSGDPAVVEVGCKMADISGSLVLVGTVMSCEPMRLDAEGIVRRLLSIQGVHNYAPIDLQSAIEFLYRFHDRFPFAGLVANRYPLERASDAIEFALQERPVRVAVVPS